MKSYESGDLIPSEYVLRRRAYSIVSPAFESLDHKGPHAMVIRKVPFKEVVDRADDELLEYDVDDMWQTWTETGCYEVLYDGNLIWWWPRNEQVKVL